MISVDLDVLESQLPRLHNKTLGELSRNDDGKVCLDSTLSCATLIAENFDDVKEDWYNQRFRNQVRSADALYKHNERYYLIEFKTGKPENVDIHRKLYDSVLGIIEHNVLNLEECRTKLQYVVVSLKYTPYLHHEEMMRHFDAGDAEPWEYEVTQATLKSWDKHDVKKLSGFLVEKIYLLSPMDFERFAHNRQWSN